MQYDLNEFLSYSNAFIHKYSTHVTKTNFDVHLVIVAHMFVHHRQDLFLSFNQNNLYLYSRHIQQKNLCIVFHHTIYFAISVNFFSRKFGEDFCDISFGNTFLFRETKLHSIVFMSVTSLVHSILTLKINTEGVEVGERD